MTTKKKPEVTVNTRSLWADLAKAEGSADYERALKISNRLINLLPPEQRALAGHCKVVILIQLNKFDDALKVIKQQSQEAAGKLLFEKAYCEYRLNRSDEALATLQARDVSEHDLRCRELMAQLLYRKEQYRDCYNIYTDVMRETQDDFEEERQINMLAVLAQLRDITSLAELDPTKNYEFAFNQAARLLAAKKYAKSEKMLRIAQDLCSESVDEEDLEEERAGIRTQLAYVLEKQGKLDEALDIYNEIIRQKPEDITLSAVASNNFIAIKRDSNLFDSRKKMKICQSKEVQQKLNSMQTKSILVNSTLLNLYNNQLEPCRAGIAELETKFKAQEETAMLRAGLKLREKKFDQSIQILKEFQQSGQACSQRVPLALAQLYLHEGDSNSALELLKPYSDQPSILGLCVGAAQEKANPPAACQLLEAALAQHKGKNVALEKTIREELAKMAIASDDFSMATKHLEELRRLAPNDPGVIAKLIKAYSKYDAAKAEELSNQSSTEASIDEGIDVDLLESSAWLKYGGLKPKSKAKEAKEADVLKKKRKKNRKPRLPKVYDPNVPPDPERWMPRWERSQFKRKKDKRAREKDVSRGTQGTAAVNDQLDSGTQKTSEPSTPSSPQVAGPRQQRPTGAQQKRKPKPKAKGKW